MMVVLDIEKILIVSINAKFYRNFSVTKEYRNFKYEIMLSLKRVKIESPYEVMIYAETYLDVTNFEKAIIDCLQESNIIDNDRNVLLCITKKIPIKRNAAGRLKVIVNTLSCNEPPGF